MKKKWHAQKITRGVKVHLGYFADEADAARAVAEYVERGVGARGGGAASSATERAAGAAPTDDDALGAVANAQAQSPRGKKRGRAHHHARRGVGLRGGHACASRWRSGYPAAPVTPTEKEEEAEREDEKEEAEGEGASCVHCGEKTATGAPDDSVCSVGHLFCRGCVTEGRRAANTRCPSCQALERRDSRGKEEKGATRARTHATREGPVITLTPSRSQTTPPAPPRRASQTAGDDGSIAALTRTVDALRREAREMRQRLVRYEALLGVSAQPARVGLTETDRAARRAPTGEAGAHDRCKFHTLLGPMLSQHQMRATFQTRVLPHLSLRDRLSLAQTNRGCRRAMQDFLPVRRTDPVGTTEATQSTRPLAGGPTEATQSTRPLPARRPPPALPAPDPSPAKRRRLGGERPRVSSSFEGAWWSARAKRALEHQEEEESEEEGELGANDARDHTLHANLPQPSPRIFPNTP